MNQKLLVSGYILLKSNFISCLQFWKTSCQALYFQQKKRKKRTKYYLKISNQKFIYFIRNYTAEETTNHVQNQIDEIYYYVEHYEHHN